MVFWRTEGFVEEERQGDVCEIFAKGLFENGPHDGTYAAVIIFLLWDWQDLPSGWRGFHLPARKQPDFYSRDWC